MRALVASAAVAAAIVAGCGGDEEQVPTTSVATTPAGVPETAAVPEEADATGQQPDATAPSGVDDTTAPSGEEDESAVGAAPETEAPSPDDVQEYVEEQRELADRIRGAADEAQATSDPQALLELREELRPSPEERRQIKRYLRQFCARPEAPESICDRAP